MECFGVSATVEPLEVPMNCVETKGMEIKKFGNSLIANLLLYYKNMDSNVVRSVSFHEGVHFHENLKKELKCLGFIILKKKKKKKSIVGVAKKEYTPSHRGTHIWQPNWDFLKNGQYGNERKYLKLLVKALELKKKIYHKTRK
jgi:hypothetical protein